MNLPHHLSLPPFITHLSPGDTALLLCRYTDNFPESLYSLKWYKDEVEFYRFEPWINGEKERVFDVPGIRVDVRNTYSLPGACLVPAWCPVYNLIFPANPEQTNGDCAEESELQVQRDLQV